MSGWMLQLQDREGRVCVPSGPWFWCDDFISCKLALLLALTPLLHPVCSIVIRTLRLIPSFAQMMLEWQFLRCYLKSLPEVLKSHLSAVHIGVIPLKYVQTTTYKSMWHHTVLNINMFTTLRTSNLTVCLKV